MNVTASFSTAPAGSWFCRYGSTLDARVRLFCFPFAGGGPAVYRTWAELCSGIDVAAIQLPGREARVREAPFSEWSPLLAALRGEFLGQVDRPYALFGHSLGAILAFELCHALMREGAALPRCLFVSGRRAPHVGYPYATTERLSDAEFLLALHHRYKAVPSAVLNDPELQRFFLPLLRADIGLVESYRCEHASPLPLPIVAFAGDDDDEARPEQMEAWRRHTSSEFELHVLPGGHFFINAEQAVMTRTICEKLARLR